MPVTKRKIHPFDEFVKRGLTKIKKLDQKGRVYVSNASFCERQGTLAATQVATSITQSAVSTAYFKAGDSIEDLVLGSWQDQNALLFGQLDLPNIGRNIGGRADGIVKLPNDPLVYVLEVKSCGTLPTKPQPEHASQAIFYSAILGFPAKISYLERNVTREYGDFADLELRTFDLPFDRETLKASIERIIRASFGVEYLALPEIPLHIKSSSQCGFCRFKRICWENENHWLDDWNVAIVDTDILEQIEQTTQDLMANLEHRRMGVLKHMQTYGNDVCKQLLNTEKWSNLVLDI